MQKSSKRSSKARGREVVFGSSLTNEAAAILRRGGIGILLTDTIYGIVGSALSKKTVERIYEVKGRDDAKPLIVLISSLADLVKFHIVLTAREKKIVQKLLRDAKRPTTIILPISWKRSVYLHRGTERFRFRIPNDSALQRFLKRTGPLVAPSANPQGKPPAENTREALAYFGDSVDFYLDGGTRRGKPSRLIELKEDGSTEIIRK